MRRVTEPKVGQKVTWYGDTGYWEGASDLEVGKEYTIDTVTIEQWVTFVTVVGSNGRYNSCDFKVE